MGKDAAADMAGGIDDSPGERTRDDSLAARLTGLSDVLPAAILILGFAAVSFIAFRGQGSADITALWLAGDFFAQGRPDLVYPADTTVFTLIAPREWYGAMAARGLPGDVFPFLYPPLWAWAMARIASIADLGAVRDIASALNPLLLGGCMVLAHRIARPPLALATWVAFALVCAMFSATGLVAIIQNQPQILVSFLVLLAIERSERGAPRAAGAVLALAAALKLYPALLVLVWLRAGNRAAARAFLLTGALLAALSVALAGWPLHAEFLRLTHVLSQTGMATKWSYGLDRMIGEIFLHDRFRFIETPGYAPAGTVATGWQVFLKPAALVWTMGAAQVAAVAACAEGLRRTETPTARAAVWAALLTALAFLGPIGWIYYYIAPMAFAPLLMLGTAPFRGLAVIALLCLGMAAPLWYTTITDTGPFAARNLLGGCMALAMGAAFASVWHMSRRAVPGPRSQPRPPPRPPQ